MTLSLHKKLFSLQQEVGKISKDATNPFFKSKYVDINSLISQLIPLLQKNRLLLMQPVQEGFVTSNIICIDSDENVESNMRLPELDDPQKVGSCITYYRRYTLLALLGLPAEDDDGNVASNKKPKEKVSYSNPVVTKKPFLLNSTPEYAKVVDYIGKGEADLVMIKKKYDMNNLMEQQLIKLINLNDKK
tara:strand:+ start:2126 stop:2692 length:567 start_codon:yes stop_codon:yes gene_type:complete